MKKSPLFTKVFWVYAFERGVKAASNSVLTLISVGYVGLAELDYPALGGAAGLAAAISVLDSLKKFTASVPDPVPAPEAEVVSPEGGELPADATQELRVR